ncbi:amidase family protein [Streptomyces sp. NBC_00075]|uniref:amidase family protein n=1 Tax=Streptomyces sp. NBC_00075 TaxID=2975641 RepID=UPI003864CF19
MPEDLTWLPPWRLRDMIVKRAVSAVAAGLVPITIGTDGHGSVRLPAALRGIVRIHLSRGLVPVVDYPWPTLSTSR